MTIDITRALFLLYSTIKFAFPQVKITETEDENKVLEKFKVLLKIGVKKYRWAKLDHADSLLDKSIEKDGII